MPRQITSPFILHALRRKYAYATYKLVKTEIISAYWGETEKRIYDATFYNCFDKVINEQRIPAWGGETLPEGVFVDLRSLQLIKWGCCPDVLAIDMVEGYE